ncbi:hypothetical protein VP01_8338g1, partial [Puccinia sorghi]
LSCLREQNSWVMLYFLNVIRQAPNAAEVHPTSVTLVQERDDMTHIATVLLPLMESFLGRGAIIGRRKWVFPILYRVTSKSAEYNGIHSIVSLAALEMN